MGCHGSLNESPEAWAAPARPVLGNATHYASGIYVIENTANGKRYVGSAVQVRKRWKLHRRDLKRGGHHCRHLQNSWNKYGGDAFTLAVVEFVERDRLLEREQYWMDTLQPEYNTLRVAGSSVGHPLTPEHRAKISAALMGHKINVGRKHTEETRRRIGDGVRGKRRTPEQCERIRAAGVGRTLSPETRAAISAAHKGRKRSPETCARIAEAVRLSHARRREAAACAC